jgi:hypothetical protein
LKRLAVWLSIRFRWTSLRTLSNSQVTRSAVIIPLIGYMLIFNDKISRFLNLAAELGGSESISGLSPRLLWIYFGLCFVAFANALYNFCCPREVKEYPSASAYLIGETESLGETALSAISSRLSRSDMKEDYQKVMNYYAGRPTEYRKELLRLNFDFLNTRHRSVRILSAISYIIGFLCLGVPSAQVFVRVLRMLAHSVFQQLEITVHWVALP